MEVDLQLLSPFEQYKQKKEFSGGGPLSENDNVFRNRFDEIGYAEDFNDYSFETNCFKAFVDGRPIHKVQRKGEKNGFKLYEAPRANV